MSFKFSPYTCGSDDNCNEYTFWDNIRLTEHNDQIDGLRKMRFGMLMIHCGLYMMIVSVNLMKTDKTNNRILKSKESYNKNVWFVTLWERYNFLWIWGIFLIFELYRIIFSFTDAFGNNVYLYIGVYKVLGIISELIVIYYLKDDL